uniref:Uncharacterized protein n=2 Tax=Anguilla anguilla TaxID=7936 RepID=A0A0E9R3N0_ANGAN
MLFSKYPFCLVVTLFLIRKMKTKCNSSVLIKWSWECPALILNPLFSSCSPSEFNLEERRCGNQILDPKNHLRSMKITVHPIRRVRCLSVIAHLVFVLYNQQSMTVLSGLLIGFILPDCLLL